MRAALIAIFAFGAAVSCAEEVQNLRGEKLRDTGIGGDTGETERRDGSVDDRGVADLDVDGGPNEFCCIDSLCIGCRGQEYPAGGCGPEYCGPNPPRFECPIPTEAACRDCTTLSENECIPGSYGIPGCEALYCNQAFQGCYPTEAMPDCNMHCGVWNTEESCNSSLNCHAVYRDSDRCDCNEPGCCLDFAVCATGPAICNPPAECPSPMAACGPNYVVSYVLPECFEGCVRPEDCAP